MVGFSIELNGKTNHKLPVTGYGKFERPRNLQHTPFMLPPPVVNQEVPNRGSSQLYNTGGGGGLFSVKFCNIIGMGGGGYSR